MKCPKCGNPIAPTARFCGVCGTAITQEMLQEAVTNTASPSKKTLPSKKMLALGGIAVVAVVVIGVLINILKPSNYVILDNAPFFVRQNDGEIVITHASGTTSTIEGEYANELQGSLDLSKGAVVIETPDEQTDEYVRTLYYVSKDGIRAFADSTGGYVQGIESADGSTVVFASDIDYSNDRAEGVLRVFDGDTTHTISSEFYPNSNFCVSPDGSTVIYSADYDGEDFTTYMWKGGKSTSLDDNLYPLAVSNGGKQIYFVDDGKLYVQKGDDRTRLTSDDSVAWVYFNKNNSEILFSTYDDTYLCVEGGERFSLDGNMSSLVLPVGVNQAYSSSYSQIVNVNLSTFKNVFYSTDAGVYRITEEFESERAVKSNDGAMLADDEKTIIYRSSGAVYMVDGFNKSAQATRLVDESVSDFRMSSDGKTLYYITYDGDLYYKKGTSEPKLIDYDLSSERSQFAFHEKSNAVFYINDGELYSSKNGEKPALVNSVASDDLLFIVSSGVVVIYNSNYEIAYWSSDGVVFHSMDTQ